MADLSLSMLPTATAASAVTPGTAVAEGAGDGATPFATLLTALADTPVAAGTMLPGGVTLPAIKTVTPVILTDPGLVPSDAESPDADAIDKDAAAPDPAAGEAMAASTTPDLSAFLRLIAPPPQIAAMPVRTVTDPATRVTGSSAPAIPAAPTIPVAPAAAPIATQSAAPSLPDTAIVGLTSAQTDAPASIAPERMAQAFAALRAMEGEPMARADTAPRGAAPASPAARTVVAHASPPGAPSTTPIADAAVATPVPATATPQADQTPVAPMISDNGAVPRAAAPATPPALASPQRGMEPTPPTAATTASEPHPAPVRARKSQETSRIADIRTDAAPARIEITPASATTATPIADDPVARQLSIAQDGRWLDSLAKDIASAGNATGQINFRLDPDHLGSLTVQIAQGSDGASIRLTASSEAARTILADAQPRLVAEARAQGLNLRDATVETRTTNPAPTPAASTNAGFSQNGSGRNSEGGLAAQLQQQSQQQQGGSRQQRAPDQPARANPVPRAASTRSGADLYA